jgi:ABC-2 type transport system permease protein
VSGVFRNVFLKSLRDQRRGLLGWSLGLSFLVFVESAVWPTIRDMDCGKLLESYPKSCGRCSTWTR